MEGYSEAGGACVVWTLEETKPLSSVTGTWGTCEANSERILLCRYRSSCLNAGPLQAMRRRDPSSRTGRQWARTFVGPQSGRRRQKPDLRQGQNAVLQMMTYLQAHRQEIASAHQEIG